MNATGVARRRTVVWLIAALLVGSCSSSAESAATPTRSASTTAATSTPGTVEVAATTAPTDEPIATAEPQPTQAQALLPTPVCSPGHSTPAMTEGPYYTPNSPERASLLEPDMTGTRIVISGYVLGTDCQPIPGAWIDFWQADDDGVYDNVGYRLRGHQFSDASGRYTLETILPGLYPGRTRHIHVKVQAPNGPILTTQLFFPGEAQNSADTIFDASLIVSMQETTEGLMGTYDFVVERAP